MKTLFRMLALLIPVSASVVAAQTDGMAPRFRPDGGSLSPVVLTYVAAVQHGSEVRSLGERTVQLGMTTYAGLSAWEIVETRGAGVSASVDTLVADYLTLAPYHWGAMQPMPALGGGVPPIGARVAAEFRADTMMGVMSSPGARKSMVVELQPGAYITAAHFEVALRGLPVAGPYWRDSTWVVVSGVGKSTALPAAMQVIGEERVPTTAGTYDCWILVLTTEVGSTQYWVSKADRIVVQSRQVIPETGSILQYQLSRISH